MRAWRRGATIFEYNDVSTRRGEGSMERMTRFPIRRYSSLEAMKADEYNYWRERPAYERLAAVSDLSTETYRVKDAALNVFRLQRTLSHLKR